MFIRYRKIQWAAKLLLTKSNSLFRQVETVGAVEYLPHLVYLKEGGASAFAERAAQVGYLVVKVEVFLLSEHPHCRKEQVLG